MRARWLKPEFFTDKKVASLGPIAALVFQALWCMADDGGTAPCDADTVKAQMFYRWSAVGVPEITEALHALSATGRIVRYVVGDDTYATIPTWSDHQKVHKPSTFRYPDVEQGVVLGVPEECLTGASPLPASPPPRHLDSQTPRHLEGAGAPPAVPVIRVVSPDVDSVFAHYRSVHPKKRPDEDKGRRFIQKGLRSFSVLELCEAIDGNASDDWCRRTGNQSLPYILKDNAQIDKYRSIHAETQPRLAVDPLTGLPNAVGMAALTGRSA